VITFLLLIFPRPKHEYLKEKSKSGYILLWQYVQISTSENLFRFFQRRLNKNKYTQWFISGLLLSKFLKLSYFTLYLLRNLNVRDKRKKSTCLTYVNITSSLTNHSVTKAKYGQRYDLQKYPV